MRTAETDKYVTEILPCPFCGLAGRVYKTQKSEQYGVACSSRDIGFDKCPVNPSGCHRSTAEESVIAWNQRHEKKN